MKKNPTMLIDYYKAGHYFQQPKGVKKVYSTWTARSNKYHSGCEDTVVFGHQAFIKEYFIDFFNNCFFNVPIDELRADYEKKMNATFDPIYTDFSRFEALHKLGYLPLEVRAVPEGTILPIRIPQAVMWNTHPDFGWLPQYLEDMWSCHNWLPSTSATTAYYRRKDLEPFFEETCDDPTAIRRICGDFSLRGMTSEDAAYASSAGHCLSFDRSATVDVNGFFEEFYCADISNQPPAFGTPSLEHSVVCQGIAYYTHLLMTKQLDAEYQEVAQRAGLDWELSLIGEMLFLYHLLTKVQPSGILSYVSDTMDYWGVLSKVALALYPEIMARNGKLVFRPDSGDPEKIVNGDPEAKEYPQRVGSIQFLAEQFGEGTKINAKGYMVLDPHVGLIYGDAITRERAINIAEGLKKNKLSIENVTFGIGAFTYQYVTRDTRGYAIKATAAEFEDFGVTPLFKNPKTDDGTKVSLRGTVIVTSTNGRIECHDNLPMDYTTTHKKNMLRPIFRDGKQLNVESVYQIRERLWDGKF
jgi:nicotinamide phosphoribosyltransferase